MKEIKVIQKYVRAEIESVDKQIEEEFKVKSYADLAVLQSRKEALIWVWNLIEGFKNN